MGRPSTPSRETEALCSGEPSYLGNAPSFRSATIRCSSSCQRGLQAQEGTLHRFQDLPLEEGPQILKAKGAVRQKEEHAGMTKT